MIGKRHTALIMSGSKAVIVLVLFLFAQLGYAQYKNEADLKKQAEKYFEDEDYNMGGKLYGQLVSNYPKDPVFNYRLGVCYLYNSEDKKKCIPFLQLAAKSAKDNEKEALFYLAKAYHINYRFDEAIKYYVSYKDIASASMIKKLQVDQEIQACRNGKRLLTNLSELVVLENKELSQADYFRSYDLKSIGGKLLTKPDEFTSAADKKKKDKSIIYLPKTNDVLYYASYGDKGDNKDIYQVKKLPNGDWAKPENLGAPINTEFDEDYPFLHPNGRVLYFASKGHNTMGGYDLFKSEFDPASDKWKEPVNLEFPINSPNDDILFVTDSLEKIAYFATTRQSPWNKIDVLKILTEKRPAEFAYIKGIVLKKDPSQSVQSKIKIKNIETGEDIGSFSADAQGNYSLKLPNGGKFIFTVETPGMPTQSESVNIPVAYTYKPYQQEAGYENKKLFLTNHFDSQGEADYQNMLSVIEEKSKMTVNAGEFGVNPDNPLANSSNNRQPSANNEQLSGNNNPSANENNSSEENESKKNLSTQELVKMAYEDAKELQQNADSLKQDASTAFAAANSKQDQANAKKQEYEQALAKVNAETNLVAKQDLQKQANQIKENATLYTAQATTANNMAKQLALDASNKQKEADLNLQYAQALEEAEKTKNNKEAIAKLEALQKQVEELSKQKSNSNTLLESIKQDAQNKQQELKGAEEKYTQLDQDVTDITSGIKDLDKQISEAKDKDLIENLKSQKQDQETDLVDKQKERDAVKTKIDLLKEEAETLKSQAEFASNIVSGNNEQLSSNNNQITENTNQTENTTEQTSNNNQAQNNTEEQQVNEQNNQSAENTNQVATNQEQNNNQQTENNVNSSIEEQNKQADDLSRQARELRTQAKNLNGTEKQNAFNKISELENKASQIRYSATRQQLDTDKQSFETNDKKIAELSANSSNGTQAKQLADEAAALSKDAQQLREEAESAPSTAAKVGGLNNAEEKQKEALAKQEQALKLLGTTGEQVADNNQIQNNNNQTENTTEQTSNNNQAQNNTEEQQVNEQNNQSAENTNQVATNQEQNNNQQTENNVNSSIEEQNKQADDLSRQARELRTQAKNLNGTEKQNAFNKISELENKASQIRYSATRQQLDTDKQSFETNDKKIAELSANSSVATQAKQLADEAAALSKDAQQLREEAESAPSTAAKVGGLNNAEEKQKEALAKQEQALKLLGATSEQVANNNQIQNNNEQITNANQTENTTEQNSNNNNQIESSNNQTSNDNQVAVNTNENSNQPINSVQSETNTPTANNSNLNDQQIAQVKNSTEYKQYVTLKNEAEKYTNQASNELSRAQLFKNRADETALKANQLKIEADALPEGAEKENKLQEAQATEQKASMLKAQSDSLQELASNTKRFAETKKQEADDYIQTLDNNTASNVASVANNSAATTNENAVIEDNNDSNYSDSFKNTANRYDVELAELQTKERNSENIEAESEILAGYIKAIDAEIAQKQQEERAAPAADKNKITQQITALRNKRQSFKGIIDANLKDNQQVVSNNNQATNNTGPANNNNVSENRNAGTTNSDVAKYVGTKGFEIKSGNAYSAKKPIPINEKLPDGLVFRVQIGAFKNPIPMDAFRGLAPVGGESTPQGFIRYQAGMFDKYGNANAVKNDLKKLGYRDAFVVAYLNGKRISLAEALANLQQSGQLVNTDAIETAGITENSNIPKNTEIAEAVQPVQSSELTTVNGLLLTVQIGVFTNNVSANQLRNLKPIFREQLPNGNYRYTAGIYSNVDRIKADRVKVNALGITDAFVSAYLNGARITASEAIDKINNDKSIQLSSEKPIIFPNEGAVNTPVNNESATNEANNVLPNNIQPFSNGVTEGPVPTAENGVKTDEAGITFKVQIGAFKNQVPQSIADTWLQVKTWPIKNMQVNGLYLYTVGSFTEARFAQSLRDEVIGLGIKDAFITVFRDGKKLYGAEAQQYLNR